MSQNYLLTIQYDGSRYRGWQRLKDDDLTIQGKLCDVLSVFEGHTVNVIGSGRTDAGVHARGQMANVSLNRSTTPLELMDYLNRYLPEDIAVTNVLAVDERFHARYSAKRKTYRYTIRTSNIPDVFNRKYQYSYLDSTLDIKAMREACKYLIGTHDFLSFCGNSHIKKSTVRTIYSIDIKEDNQVITIDFCGDGFLQNMVRILTGTLIEVGTGKRSASSIPKLLEDRNRAQAGFTAPASGLTLMNVEY